MLSRRVSYYARTGVIVLVSGIFLTLSHYVRDLAGHNLFTILFPAVALSAWVGGRLGGLLSTVTLTLGSAYYHLPPEGFAIADPDDVIRLGTFTLSGAFVAWLSGALKESQGFVRATLQSIGDAVIATDRRGRVRVLNPTAEMLTGWSQQDARGRQLSDIFRSVRTETGELLPLPPESISGRADLPSGVSLVSKSGNRIPIDDSFAPVQIDSGETLGSIVVFRDATRRLQNEVAALESERHRLRGQRMEAVGRLAGGVAHDFNNLLTVINGYADMMVNQVGPEHPLHGSAEAILQAGERAAALTRQLLLFSRGQPSKLEVADLNVVVAGFEKMLRRLIAEDIELVLNLSSQPLPVLVDIGQIEQVIMNLATNARDAMPHGGRLTLVTRRAEQPCGPCAQLEVADTGVGMDPETAARVFEPFFTTKGVNKGTGLGLSVTYGIVKSHKGNLEVYSRPGHGSVFRACLPMTDAVPEQASRNVGSAEAPATKATILLVEDNPDVRHLMRDILAGAGYIVLEASGVDEAMAIGRDHPGPIDLLVSDVVMPGFSGVELGRRLMMIRPRMAVLYVSGYSGEELASRVTESSELTYLQKPFGPAELSSRVAEILSRSRNIRVE